MYLRYGYGYRYRSRCETAEESWFDSRYRQRTFSKSSTMTLDLIRPFIGCYQELIATAKVAGAEVDRLPASGAECDNQFSDTCTFSCNCLLCSGTSLSLPTVTESLHNFLNFRLRTGRELSLLSIERTAILVLMFNCTEWRLSILRIHTDINLKNSYRFADFIAIH
jgi:hypothetical protein